MHQRLIEFEPLKEISQQQEQLLCETLKFEAVAAKRPSTQKPQTKEMEKQARKDLQFQVAAKHSMKKRKRLSEAPEPNSDEPIDDFDARVNGYGPFAPDDESGNSGRFPKLERMSWNGMLQNFLSDSKSMRDKELQLKESALELEKKREERLAAEQTMKLEIRKGKLEVENKKEDNRSEELKAR
ncbi:uncharacterized protein LOC129600825 [Paramacrobiotus metropolitanus]|uniref:uncharacterized protein LOC129600825 n=1 Tax=Paramacrobiotus metropolitanus TaxID=2943436 RepID=UPI002445B811|nr:uncharacterized protein LOC129600825 [Paramacrobiotus metropolitanus]